MDRTDLGAHDPEEVAGLGDRRVDRLPATGDRTAAADDGSVDVVIEPDGVTRTPAERLQAQTYKELSRT